MSNSLFIDIGSCQRQKDGEDCFGDTIYSKKIPEERRVISILSDGLGSGVKANILSSMTTRMAMKFMEDNTDLLRSSEIMMDALPICQIRKISYATFSIVDSELEGKTRIFEMDNPATSSSATTGCWRSKDGNFPRRNGKNAPSAFRR